MNKKIKNYVDVLFSDVPKSRRALELKEELQTNMSDRFDDYISQGQTENQAYSLTLSNMGDIDSLLLEVMPDAEFKQGVNAYRKKNAKTIAIAVSMYIIGVVVFIGFAALGEYFFPNMADAAGLIGLLLMLILAAIATGIIIYTNMSTPIEYRDFDSESKKEAEAFASPKGSIFKRWMSIYWMSVTLVYLTISFITHSWHVTWLIWILAAILEEIIKTIFELGGKNE